MYRKAVGDETQKKIARAALLIIAQRHQDALDFYKKQDVRTADYLSHILSKYLEMPNMRAEHSAPSLIADEIAETWRSSSRRGPELLKTGLYQMFRRYKPTAFVRDGAESSGYDWSIELNHIVICEVFYVDSANMECILVTSELNVYYGSLFITHEKVLFGTLQRKATRAGGVNQRFIALKLEEQPLPFYSGLCVKAGDTTRQPVASECLFVELPIDHTEAHTSFATIRDLPAKISRIERDSPISQYITSNPPRGPYNPGNPGPACKRGPIPTFSNFALGCDSAGSHFEGRCGDGRVLIRGS
jgi:hypothetical protein